MALTPQVSGADHAQGAAHAIIELVEYGDFQCPDCAQAHPVLRSLQQRFGPDLRFVFRHFPLSALHPQAKPAALAAEAAGLQGRFWDMHDFLFEHQEALKLESLFLFAKGIALDMPQFQRDFTRMSLLRKLEADFESGVRSGVSGTPGFFVNGRKYNGGRDLEHFSTFLQNQIDYLKQNQAILL